MYFLRRANLMSALSGAVQANTLLLNGSSQYLSVPDSTDFFFGTGDFTWAGYFRYSSQKNWNGLFGHFQDASNRALLYTNASQQIGFFVQSGGASVADYATTGVSLSNNTWYHIAIVRSGSTITIYLDGVSQTLSIVTPIGAGSYPDYSATFDIGRVYIGGSLNYFGGSVTTVNITNSALTIGEILELVNSGKTIQPWLLSTPIQTAMVLALPLNSETNSNEYNDYSGSINNGTPIGGPTITGDLITIETSPDPGP